MSSGASRPLAGTGTSPGGLCRSRFTLCHLAITHGGAQSPSRMETDSHSPIPTAEALRSAKSHLRLGERRPSVPDLLDLGESSGNLDKSRFAARELSISQEGWLTKLSSGGMPNGNKRWFILIGGSLYYSRSDKPSSTDLQVFAELLHADHVELAPSQAGYSFVFKLQLDNEEQLVFAAPSNDLRLTWMGVLEEVCPPLLLHAESSVFPLFFFPVCCPTLLRSHAATCHLAGDRDAVRLPRDPPGRDAPRGRDRRRQPHHARSLGRFR